MSSHLPSNTKRVLVVHNNSAPQIDQVNSVIQRRLGKANQLILIKKTAKIKSRRKHGFHVYARKSPISVAGDFKLVWRLREMKPDIILIKKHDLNPKLLLLVLTCSKCRLVK